LTPILDSKQRPHRRCSEKRLASRAAADKVTRGLASGTDWPGNQQASTRPRTGVGTLFRPSAAAAATAPGHYGSRPSITGRLHSLQPPPPPPPPLVVNHARFKLKHPPATSPSSARLSWESTAVCRSALLRPSTGPCASRPGQLGRRLDCAVQCSGRLSGGSWSGCPLTRDGTVSTASAAVTTVCSSLYGCRHINSDS